MAENFPAVSKRSSRDLSLAGSGIGPPNAHVQLQGALPSKFVILNLKYQLLAHNLMPVAPVCCNM